MARYPLGQPVRVTFKTYQPDGTTLVNATANSLTLKIVNADGTTTATAGSPYTTPVNDSTGAYHQDVPASDLAALGHYQWVNTATGTGAGIQFGDFDVFDPYELAFLPLDDAMAALNITAAQRTGAIDAEVGQYVATIESCLEAFTGGPLVNRSISERAVIQAAYTVIMTRQRPLVSVTSIVSVASGSPIDITAGLDIDPLAGTVRRKLGYPFYGPYFTWLPAMTITYVAGWGVTVPAAFNTAGRMILQSLWDTQHGPSARPSMGPSELVTLPGFGFLVPSQAAQILDGSVNGLPLRLEAYI
jgi:hypothetical protein